MTTQPVLSSARRRRQRGSQSVEAALITLIMFALVFLLMDISLSLFIKSTLQEAARDGVRFAVTEQVLSGDSGSIAEVVSLISNGPCEASDIVETRPTTPVRATGF